MKASAARWIGPITAIVGFLGVWFIPPLFVPPNIVNDGPSIGAIIRVAWSAAITGAVMGIGLGLFIGSFFGIKRKD